MKNNHQILIATNTHYTTVVMLISVTVLYHKTHRDKQLSDGVVGKHLLVCESDFERTVLLGPLLWPVMLTLVLSPFHSIGYHGNHTDSFLPHHPPEVSDSVWEGTYRKCESSELQLKIGYINLRTKKIISQ